MSAAHPEKTRYIELNLNDVSQLFNSMDPSPFHQKDLDHDAEEFIVSWAQEYPAKAPLALRVHLADWPASLERDLLARSIHNYFAYRGKLTQLEFRRLLDQGWKSMVIGLAFLGLCFFTSEILLAGRTGPWFGFLREGLLIAGWVAMWRPMQIYLYEWWPLRRRERIFEKLSRMPVEVLQKK